MFGKFRMGDMFPHQSNLSTWVVTVAMMSNDVVLASSSLERVLHDDRPTMKGERFYWFRLATSHYREAVKFFAETRSKAYVVQFIQSLPCEVQDAYRLILDNSSKPGENTLFGQEVVSTRTSLFIIHPAPKFKIHWSEWQTKKVLLRSTVHS